MGACFGHKTVGSWRLSLVSTEYSTSIMFSAVDHIDTFCTTISSTAWTILLKVITHIRSLRPRINKMSMAASISTQHRMRLWVTVLPDCIQIQSPHATPTLVARSSTWMMLNVRVFLCLHPQRGMCCSTPSCSRMVFAIPKRLELTSPATNYEAADPRSLQPQPSPLATS